MVRGHQYFGGISASMLRVKEQAERGQKYENRMMEDRNRTLRKSFGTSAVTPTPPSPYIGTALPAFGSLFSTNLDVNGCVPLCYQIQAQSGNQTSKRVVCFDINFMPSSELSNGMCREFPRH
jgi:hypothetical protein